MRKILIATVITAFGGIAFFSGPLTIEDLIKAQDTSERVYYNHCIWPKDNPRPKPTFEQMITRAQIEAKVTDHQKKSAANEPGLDSRRGNEVLH